ncbi:vacuolar-type H+-ATPase catalytic subunit A/Vma1 [Streptomyces sp. SAI-170]|uniref:hypothetical protein n=1 Tax=Streptomyces sp. SAI-170 TaxID=3377729 RepID=UPI003C7DD9A3
MPRPHRSAPWQIADLFAHEREAIAYAAVVDTCLAEPAVARRLGKRPQATAENVRAAMLTEANVRRALQPCEESRRRFQGLLGRFEATRLRREYVHDPVAPATVVLCLLGLFFLGALAVASWTVVGLAALPPALAALAVHRNPLWRMRVRHNLSEAALAAVLWIRGERAGSAERRWRRDLQLHGVGPLMERVVEALLGDDVDSLLLPDSYDGLRSPRNRQYVIGNEAARQLARKVAQREGGTIAVSGPRGAGKTTLLESCAEEADFAVVVQAPASYSPYEFLLSLYITVCERYLTEHGQDVPEFARLSAFRRAARSAGPALRRVTRFLLFALPAGALVVLGLGAATRSAGVRYDDPALDTAQDLWDGLTDTTVAVWRGERVGQALAATLAGVLLWRLRRSARLGSLLSTGLKGVSLLAGYALVVSAPVSLLFDDDVRRNARDLVGQSPEMLVALAVGVGLAALMLPRDLEAHVGALPALPAIPLADDRRFRRGLTGVLLVADLYLLSREPSLGSVVTDTGNPLRAAGLLLGLVLIRAGSWTAPRPEAPLVTRCRNQLYRLQTVQTSATAVTTGPPQLLAAHTTSLSTVPPTMPELVSDFRELLTDIARERFLRRGRVVIAIDEVDRLGSDAQALEFLGEIKAILGVPHVHCLISVAEDVGASFVRRGLPHRGVTDSSLDDILHVQPCTLTESKDILQRRAPGLSEPYSLLAHALSGGLPRDLIRYGLRIMEIEDKTRFFELTDISRQMILEELAETLAGFRTLLAKQQWTPETSAVLLSFRALMAQLRHLCPCPSADLHRALHQVAFQDLDGRLGAAAGTLPEPTRLLVDEASAYVLFSLTLLDIFGRPDLTRRRAAAGGSPDGDPDLLAQARQELEISPYSARPLITAIRSAWGLSATPPEGALPGLPSPRSASCPRHTPTG